MSEKLEREAEIVKLARLLGTESADLGHLDTVSSEALAAFRLQVTDRLYAGDAGRLHRVAAAAKLVPIPITVKAAQLAFGPVLCASVAGLLDPPHAVKVAGRTPTSFLADITVHLDPRRAPAVIAAMPVDVVVAVAVELLGRGEYVTVGRFVTHLPTRTLAAAVRQITDEADILRVAFVMEGKARLDELVHIADDRIPALVQAAHRHGLWAEVLDLVDNLQPDTLARVAAEAARVDDDVLDGAVTTARDEGLWEDLLPLALAFDDETRRRLASLPSFTRPEVLADVIATAAEHDLWAELLPLADVLPEPVRPVLASLIGELTEPQLLAGLTAAQQAGNLDTLVEIALAQDPAGRARVMAVIAELPDLAPFADLLDARTGDVVWDALVQVREEMPTAVRDVVRGRASAAGREDVAQALGGARKRPRPTR